MAMVRCQLFVVRWEILSRNVSTAHQHRSALWRAIVYGHRAGPYSPPCLAGFLLSLCEAAFHGFAVSIVAAGVGQTGSEQLLVQHNVAIPDECQKTIEAIFAFEAEGEPDTVPSFLDKVL